MKAIVCVNINNTLLGISRQTMHEAALRWDVDFFEITQNQTNFHPAYVKLLAFDLTEYEDIFLIDSDCLISPKCPNPFEYFPKQLMVVKGAIPRLVNYIGIRQHIIRELAIFNEAVSYYFNSGVMLVNRTQHEECFNYAKYLYKDELSWHDQTPLNIALKTCPVTKADETWNYIPQNSGDATKFIYHFAGYINKPETIKEFYGKVF